MKSPIPTIIVLIAAMGMGFLEYFLFERKENNYPKNPASFDFVFQYGIEDAQVQNELNTFTDIYTKDMITDPAVTTTIKLTDMEMKNIYQKILTTDLLDDKPEKINYNIHVTPCEKYYIKIKADEMEMEKTWNTCHGEMSKKKKIFVDFIKQIITTTDEYRVLPEPNGGYL